MGERTTYACQIRNPDFMRHYSAGVEFADLDTAVAQAKKASVGGLRARVMEIRRRVVWRSSTEPKPRAPTTEAEGGER